MLDCLVAIPPSVPLVVQEDTRSASPQHTSFRASAAFNFAYYMINLMIMPSDKYQREYLIIEVDMCPPVQAE